MMPGIDGYEVCRWIRGKKEHKLSKIVMISGMSMIEDRLEGYNAGADDYITKPFVEDELLAKIEVFSKLNRMEDVDNLKIFDGLYSADILHHRQGTGLILAIAKAIVEEHGGKIRCRNRKEK